MPKGRVLTPVEREQIARMHADGASAREIAKKLTRSKTVVLNFLKNPAQYAQIKRSGRKRALSRDDERRLYAALFQPSRPTQPPAGLGEGNSSTQDLGGAVPEPSAAVAATTVTHSDSRLDTTHAPAAMATMYPHQDVKMSAEQIKREFNVPLSTRRIQQLLSEWRREARRAQDRLQQEQTERAAAALAPTSELTGADSSSDGVTRSLCAASAEESSASLESLAELPPAFEDALSAPEPQALAPEDAKDPAPVAATGGAASAYLLDTAGVDSLSADVAPPEPEAANANAAAPELDITVMEV